MTTPTPRAAYTSPLRIRQKEQTRDLILGATATVLRQAGLAATTIAEIARVAEVTERTIFRHFPSREELLAAFWKWQLEKTGGQNIDQPKTLDDLLTSIRRFFTSLEADEPLLRAVLAAPEGRDVRRPANQQRLAHMLTFLAPLTPHLTTRERHSTASGIVSVCSVLSWVFMRDNCGYDGKRAGEAAAFAVQLIVEAAQARSAARAPT